LTSQLAKAFESHPESGVVFRYVPLPSETHATIYHPAALIGMRAVFAPEGKK
jgi:hypothetical protein